MTETSLLFEKHKQNYKFHKLKKDFELMKAKEYLPILKNILNNSGNKNIVDQFKYFEETLINLDSTNLGKSLFFLNINIFCF